MSTVLLVLSTICFISAYGTHIFAKNSSDCGDWCGYMAVPWMSAIPWISGFILAVIPETLLFNIYWLWMFLINLVIVFILGPTLTTLFLRAFKSGKGAGLDIIISIIIGIITLLIGAIIK